MKGWTQASNNFLHHPHPDPLSPASLSLFARGVFISSPHVYITYKSLSQAELKRVWPELRRTTSSLQHIHSLPQRTHSTLLLSKGYPSAPEPNSSHVFWERSAQLLCASLRRPRPPLTRAENATNYWGSRQWSLSFNPWQVLLGYYQDVNGRDRAVWHSRDCEGFRSAHLHERALLHQLCFDITYCWIFIKRRNHFGSKSFQNQTKNTQRWFWHKKFLCALCGGYTSPKWGVEGGTQKRGRVWDTTFLTALSGRHETMSERPPEAALVRFTLISTDEPCWLWPGNRQAAPTQSTQPLMTEVQISGRSTHMVPLHIRQLSVWQQEAVAQIYVHKTTDHFNVF